MIQIETITNTFLADVEILKTPAALTTLKKACFFAGYSKIFENREADCDFNGSLINTGKEVFVQRYSKSGISDVDSASVCGDVAGWIHGFIDDARALALRELGEAWFLQLVKNGKGWSWEHKSLNDHRLFQKRHYCIPQSSRHITFPPFKKDSL